jgi:hypothetical protein
MNDVVLRAKTDLESFYESFDEKTATILSRAR